MASPFIEFSIIAFCFHCSRKKRCCKLPFFTRQPPLVDISTEIDKLEIRQYKEKNSGVVMHWLWFLIIGAAAGWLSGRLTRGHGFGLVGDLVVGVLGAFIGGFLFRLLGIIFFGLVGSLVSATVGAVVLLWLIRLLR
jgi:uncharacterized membrane protein YeaQ/YmgE (transglycosylase-associated protein family)